jgi:dipeptidyl aminopeptidase/acylaminoacyl peptidase
VASAAILDRFEEPAFPVGSSGFIQPAFALSPDGRWLARPEGSDIMLRPIASAEPRIVLGRHGGVYALAFSPDGSMLAAACLDHTAVIWDVAKREPFGTLRGHHEKVFDVAFSPDGEWIATGSLDYTARIWETRTGQNVATLPGPGPALRVRWSPTGDYLATRTHNGRDVFLYRITGRHGAQQWLTGHRVELRSVAAHPRREQIATSGYTELCSWDVSASRPSPAMLEPNPGSVTSMAYSPDGSLLATASWNQRPDGPEVLVLIRDAQTGRIRSRISRPRRVLSLAFDPTGERLACGDQAGNVVLWDLVTSRPVREFETGFMGSSIIFLDRPRRLVTHGRDAVLLFNLESGQRDQKVDLAGGGIRKFAADRARNRLVVGFQSGAIGDVSLADLTPGPRLEHAHDGSVDCLALSPDGRLLATGGADHRVARIIHEFVR